MIYAFRRQWFVGNSDIWIIELKQLLKEWLTVINSGPLGMIITKESISLRFVVLRSAIISEKSIKGKCI